MPGVAQGHLQSGIGRVSGAARDDGCNVAVVISALPPEMLRGSIPAASTFRLNGADSAVSFGRNDFVLPLLLEPARVAARMPQRGRCRV